MVYPIVIRLATVASLATWLIVSPGPTEAVAGTSGPARQQRQGVVAHRRRPAAKPKANQNPPQATPQSGVAAAQAEISLATENLKTAREDARAGKSALDQIVHDIEEAEPTDSPFARAKTRYDAAEAARKQAVSSGMAAFKRAVDDLSDDEDRVKAVSALYKKLVTDDPDVLQATDDVAAARPEYESLRDKLLKQDQGWVDASEKLKAARKAEDSAEAALQTAARDNLSANRKLRDQQAESAGQAAQKNNSKAAAQALAAQKKAQQEQAARARARFGN